MIGWNCKTLSLLMYLWQLGTTNTCNCGPNLPTMQFNHNLNFCVSKFKIKLMFDFLYVKNGESLYSHKRHHWSYLIRRWLSVLGWTLVSAGPNEGCVHADTLTLKLVEVQNGGEGFKSEEDSILEAARSLLFIEVGECRAVVRHTFDQRLRNRKCNRRWDIRENVGRETLQDVWTILVCSVYPLRGEGACRE